MAYQPDMSQNGPFRLVGYLSRDHDYPQGEVSEAALDRLVALGLLQFMDALGYHNCDLDSCSSNQTQPELYWRSTRIPKRCRTEILVPDKRVLYKAPTLIVHYIRAHHYLPPASFLDSVLSCPEPGSDDYLRSIKKLLPNDSNYGIHRLEKLRQRSWLQRLLRIDR